MGTFKTCGILALFFLSHLFAFGDSSLVKTQPLIFQRPSLPKSVLYLGGGAHSPWYSLGVLYAVRDYQIPVDSVVATSWGAFVGSLWSSGMELDEIQKLVTDSLFVLQLLGEKSSPSPLESLPISGEGEPSLAFRFAFYGDSSGRAHFRPRPLFADREFLNASIFRFRVEEALLRADSTVLPFTAFACSSGIFRKARPAFALPFSKTSGENCPDFFPEDSSAFAVYVMAYPLRNADGKDSPTATSGFQNALEFIRREKEKNPERNIIVIRPHSVDENTPLAWMQAGYSDMERKRGEFSPLAHRKGKMPVAADSIFPRFRIEPSFEKFPSIYYSDLSSHWNEVDTGTLAAVRFLRSVSESPFYDSVQIEMDTLGIADVSAFASPVLEFRVGGFGSNLTGPLAYAGVDFRFVNQFEYAFRLEGFYGEHSRALRPEFSMRGFFGSRGEFSATGNISRIRPLRGYFSDVPMDLRLREIKQNDIDVKFLWKDSLADFSFDVLLGESDFKRFLGEDELHVNTLYPKVSFVRNRGEFLEWFGDRGYRISGDFGFRSVNLTADGMGSAPLYVSTRLDVQKNFSPLSAVALSVGALGGVQIRRESGKGYVYPDPLKTWTGGTVKSLDCWYRMHPSLSPWSASWNFTDLSTHHYTAARASAGLHTGPLGVWIFTAYMHDFEENSHVELDADRILLEPTLRFSYRSLELRLGMSRLVSAADALKLKNVRDYHYFFQVGANW